MAEKSSVGKELITALASIPFGWYAGLVEADTQRLNAEIMASGNGKGTHADVAPVLKEETKAPAAMKKNFLPMFMSRWKRRNGNGGEAAKQPVAMKK